MTTDVEICSNALLMLGDSPIADFSEDEDRVRLCANLYPSVRLSILRGHPWNCCAARVVLAPDAVAPPFGPFAYRFQLPSDCLRVISVGEDGAEIDWRTEGRYLLASDAVCKLKYVSSNVLEAYFDPLLVDLLTITMAARMAYPITKSASLAADLKTEAARALKYAKATDGQEDPPETLGDMRFMHARRGR